MSLILYGHPFSSYCWKVQIPLDADGTAYEYRNVDPSNAGAMEELAQSVIYSASRDHLLQYEDPTKEADAIPAMAEVSLRSSVEVAQNGPNRE